MKSTNHSTLLMLSICGVLAIVVYLFVFVYPFFLSQQISVVEEEAEQTIVPLVPVQEEVSQNPVDLSEAKFINLIVTKTEEIEGVEIRVRQGWVVNPRTQDRQSIRIHEPTQGKDFPAVILVPGGITDGTNFERTGEGIISEADLLAIEGMVVIVYSPLGTGESYGEMDYQGYQDQDGLAAIIQSTKTLPNVDATRVGLASFSYGITGASGTLSRYEDLGVKFLIDYEGPSSRMSTTFGCRRDTPSGEEIAPADFSCDDEDFWAQREASVFITSANVSYYWRVQKKTDHAQENGYGHTLEMMQSAVGTIPWVKLNDDEVNEIYETEDDLSFIKDKNFFEGFIIPAILDLIELTAVEEEVVTE